MYWIGDGVLKINKKGERPKAFTKGQRIPAKDIDEATLAKLRKAGKVVDSLEKPKPETPPKEKPKGKKDK
jgi:hypothetical protein